MSLESSKCDHLILDQVKTDDLRQVFFLKIAADGISHHFFQFVKGVCFCKN